MADIGPLLRTVAHLAPGQLWHRARLMARRALWERRGPAVDRRYRERAERLDPARFDHPGLARVAAFRALRQGGGARRIADDALAGRFTFLNRTLDFGREIDWYRADLDVGTRLWKTHLHEFSFAPALALAHHAAPNTGYRARLFELFDSWSAASPIGRPGFALDAWNARAVATRLVHWAVAGSLLALRSDEPEGERLGREIARHGLFLRDNLELDLRGNHLLRDAVGLVFADALCGGVPDALAWLERQVDEQILPDGCHIERAPMYHAICLQDLLEAQLLLGTNAPGWLRDGVRRMGGLLESLLLGDGDLPLLGDAWLGEVAIAPLLARCRDAVGEFPAPVEPAAHGGLVALARGPVRAVMRAGPHGPDYLLGHAHADLLSFEASVGARRVVCDTGTSRYDPGPERQHLRSTAAHNTLEVDGVEQLEAWGSFRAGRRGRARVHGTGDDGGWSWLWASSDAYQWLPGQPRHFRLLAVCDNAVLVLDALLGKGRHRVANRLHLHPDHPDTQVQALALGAEATRQGAPYHERFGETREMTRLTVATEAQLPWVGGWLIHCASETPAPVACELRIRDGIARFACSGGLDASVAWRPEEAAADDTPAVVFCSPERESAT